MNHRENGERQRLSPITSAAHRFRDGSCTVSALLLAADKCDDVVALLFHQVLGVGFDVEA